LKSTMDYWEHPTKTTWKFHFFSFVNKTYSLKKKGEVQTSYQLDLVY